MRLRRLFIASSFLSSASAQELRNVLQDNGNLSSLAELLTTSGLLDQLSTASDITVLAPSDDAFDQLFDESPDGLDQLDFVTALLQYHVLNGRYSSTNITEAGSPFIPTLLTDRAFVNITGGQVVHATHPSPNDNITIYSGYNLPSTIIQPDIPFSHGYIHIIDRTLTIPDNVTATALYSNLTSLVGATLLASFPWDNWSNATFFAPTNLAFSRIGSALTDLGQDDLHTIMMYHVINDTTPVYTSRIDHAEWISTTGTNVTWTYPIEEGETIFINEAAVTVPNVLVANGVMHILDNVLNPNGSATSTPTGTTGLPAYSAATSLATPPFTSAVTAIPTDGTPSSTSSVSPAPTASASSTADTGAEGSGAEDAASTSGISASSFMALGLLGIAKMMLVL